MKEFSIAISAALIGLCAASCGREPAQLPARFRPVSGGPSGLDAVAATPDSPGQGDFLGSGTVSFSGRSSAGTGSAISVTALDSTLAGHTCKALVRADHTWSCELGLDDGGYTWTAKVKSTGFTSAPIDFVVAARSLTAPIIDHTPSPTNDPAPILTGTVTPDEACCHFVLEVSENGIVLCTVPHLTSTDWACALPAPLSEGPHLLTADVDECSGCDGSRDSNPNLFVVKTRVATPTVAPIATPTNVNRITFHGTGEPGAILTVADGKAVLCQLTVPPGGKWACTVADPLADGRHQISVSEEDAAGNVSPTVPVSFVVDTHLPAAPTLDAPRSPTSDPRVTFSGSGEAGDQVSVLDAYGHLLCSAVVNANGRWTCAPQAPLEDGDYLLDAFQVTVVGNRSGPSSAQPLSVRTLETPVFDVPRSPTRDPSPPLSGTARPLALVVVVLGESPICPKTTADASGRWLCHPAPALADGSYLLQAEVSDALGHSSAPSSARAIVIDTTPPAAPVLEPPRSPTRKHQPLLSGNAEAESAVAVTDSSTGNIVCSVVANAAGGFSCAPAAMLPAGTYRFSATATDAAGNVSAPAIPVAVAIADNVPAPPTIESPADGTGLEQRRPVITGRTAPGTSVQVTLDGVEYSAQVGPAGFWTLLPPGELKVGGHAITAVATDVQLNVSDPATSRFSIVEGGVARGGCSSGGMPYALLVLAALLLAWPSRRQGRPRMSALAILMLPALAGAQSAVVDVSLFHPAAGGDGYAAVEGARPPVQGESALEVRTWADFAVRPLVFVSDSGSRAALVRSRAGEWLGLQVHLFGPLSIAAQLPLTLAQRGDLSSLPPASRGPSSLSAGLADLRISPRLALLRQEWAGVDLASQLSFELPTAQSQSLSGDGRVRAEGLLALGRRFDTFASGGLEVLVNGYVRLRPPREILDVKSGNEAGLRAGLGFLPTMVRAYLPRRVYAEFEGRSFLRAGFAAGSAPAEWRLGATLCPAGSVAIDLAGGGALTDGIGAPRARFLFGIGWSPSSCASRSEPAALRALAPATVLPAAEKAPERAPPTVAQLLPLPQPAPPQPDRDGDGIPDADDACPDQRGPADNHGCPRAVKSLVVVSASKIEILEQVQFATGKARIQNRSLLDQVAAVLISHPNLTLVQVEGHTDDRGSPSKNLLLSQSRAEAVAAYLESKGVESKRLRAKGFGQARPLTSNLTAGGRAANRRVAFTVLGTVTHVIEADRPPDT